MLTGVAVVAALAVGLMLYLTRSGPLPAGPLDLADGAEADSTGVNAGRSVTWGLIEVHNPGRDAIVLDKITIPSKVPGFVRQVTVIDRHDLKESTWGMIADYPPPYLRDSRAPAGTRLLPGRHLVVTIELVPPRNGRFEAGPVIFDYHIGSHRYRATSQTYGIVCAPRSRARHCPAPIPDGVG